MTLTIPTSTNAVEEVAFHTGAEVQFGATDAQLDVLTEDGVRLRLVAALGGAR